jgi:hypothetical protein
MQVVVSLVIAASIWLPMLADTIIAVSIAVVFFIFLFRLYIMFLTVLFCIHPMRTLLGASFEIFLHGHKAGVNHFYHFFLLFFMGGCFLC